MGNGGPGRLSDQPTRDCLPALREGVKMRHPGIEPGPPRWQRGIITTRLMTHVTWDPPPRGPAGIESPGSNPQTQGSGCAPGIESPSPLVLLLPPAAPGGTAVPGPRPGMVQAPEARHGSKMRLINWMVYDHRIRD